MGLGRGYEVPRDPLGSYLGPPVVPFYPFWREGSPKIDKNNRYPCSYLSTGGPSGASLGRRIPEQAREVEPILGNDQPFLKGHGDSFGKPFGQKAMTRPRSTLMFRAKKWAW